MRIALLEDDLEQAEAVRRLLEVTHTVHHYARGWQLLAKLAHESCDLLIIDGNYPISAA